MAIKGQNSCTLSTITDVKSIYTYHLLVPSTTVVTNNMAPKDATTDNPGNPPGASSITITYLSDDYIWTISEPGINIQTNDVGTLYYIECTLFSDNTFDWGPIMTSSSYEAAKQAYNRAKTALDLAGDTKQYFWEQPSAYSTNIPAGIYVTHIPQSQFKASGGPTQGNIIIQDTGITIRNGAIPLTSLTSTALNFYNPSTHEANATLSSNGLVLSKGGIQAGPPNQKGFIYLSSEDYLGDITINNHNPLEKYTEVENPEGNPKEKGWYEKNEEVYTLTEDTEVQQGKVYYQDESDPKWRQIIGNKFGVDSEGNLYAASARIGSDVKIGNETKYHISLADNEIAFWSGEESISVNKTAYITGNYMYIPYTVVLNEMRVGQGDGQAGDSAKWSWRYIESSENLRLVWLGGDGE